ncbi:hypothetical protein C4D60_Mb01t03100 [Musa balbisiana]|uniref:Uncharacterized protein n=1 Tax=Musa balbisiana TaxID=52838 RepID=A0A4S8JKA5_MUSBA|nr:hypothetical protein C4D60_Mb01t03100 [Musa balbisiana]
MEKLPTNIIWTESIGPPLCYVLEVQLSQKVKQRRRERDGETRDGGHTRRLKPVTLVREVAMAALARSSLPRNCDMITATMGAAT